MQEDKMEEDLGTKEIEGEGDYDEDYEEDELYDDEEDADQEAEEMAKRLGDALWADISKAFAAPNAQGQNNVESSHIAHSEERDDEETLINAVQEVVELAEIHSDLFQKMSETAVPGSEDNLFDALSEIVQNKCVSAELASILSDLVQSVLDGDFFQQLS